MKRKWIFCVKNLNQYEKKWIYCVKNLNQYEKNGYFVSRTVSNMKHLTGWSTGNMDGGRWVLQSWSDLDPSLYVPKPSDGKNFLFVNRFDIHSGEHKRLYMHSRNHLING